MGGQAVHDYGGADHPTPQSCGRFHDRRYYGGYVVGTWHQGIGVGAWAGGHESKTMEFTVLRRTWHECSPDVTAQVIPRDHAWKRMRCLTFHNRPLRRFLRARGRNQTLHISLRLNNRQHTPSSNVVISLVPHIKAYQLLCIMSPSLLSRSYHRLRLTPIT